MVHTKEQEFFSDSAFESDASNLKARVAGQAKIHVIVQNEKGEVLLDQTYEGK